jgi:lipoprotein-anchoring transpeptidase ErfK/SrfK
MEIENNYGDTKKISPEYEYDIDKHIEKGNHDIVDKIVNYNDSKLTVSQLWEKQTGTSWEDAKKEGLTDGSYESNIKLRSDLISNKYSKKNYSKNRINNNISVEDNDYTKSTTFNDAFQKARKSLGSNKIFEWNGKKYGTNIAGEEFKPSEEDLKQNNLNDDNTKKNLEYQNKLVKSPYTSKEVTKLEKNTYKNWESIKSRNKEINKMNNADKIVQYHSKDKESKYLIVDKKSNRMHLYQGDVLLNSFEVGTGENKGDAQTVTKVKNGKVNWKEGNKTTGAGIYTISNIDPKSKTYYGLPSFNMINENGIEVPTAIHGTPYSRRSRFNDKNEDNNRMSNGCINGRCEDLIALYSKYGVNKGTKLYILPEDEGNSFEYQDDKIILKSSSKNRTEALEYKDSNGNIQKGQGINYSTKTLGYKPIKMFIDKSSFEKDVYKWNDFNDDKEFEQTTKPFINSLVKNKKSIMKAAKIPSDIYNEIAKISFGIYGTESNFGDTHSAVGNFARAVNKYISPKSSSSPDYKSKVETYKAEEDDRSVGLTQIRFSYLNDDEKNALKEVNITSNKDFLNPEKAAMGTAIVLGIRYNQQLTDDQKQNLWDYLPTKWNKRDNYADRVKNNSKYLSIKQQE